MSSAAASTAVEKHPVDPLVARLYMAGLGAGVLVALIGLCIERWSVVGPALPDLIIWIGLVFVTDLMPVRFWGRLTFSMSLPVTLAGAFILPPLAIAAGVFLGTADLREFRGEVSWERGLFNRAQVAASVFVASALFHGIGVSVLQWPAVVPAATAAIGADFVVNMALVVVCAGLIEGDSPAQEVRGLFDGVPIPYLLTFATLGLLGLLMATLAEAVGLWAAFLFLSTLVLARQSLVHIERVHAAALDSERDRLALAEATHRMVEERRDERMVVAGELHDEVLPPLFKVHLMAQVLRQDLSAGRLLDLDDDLPELLEAISIAQSAIRGVVRDLHRSTLGSDGLAASLRRLVQRLESAGSPRFELTLHEDKESSRASQLLVYQVAREAMSNASRYSSATRIEVTIDSRDGNHALTVRDDGVGFDHQAVDLTEHFGLQLIAARVQACGGTVWVDSQLGRGTTVVASIPTNC